MSKTSKMKRPAPAARIESPLARYAGTQLMCAVCGSAVGARSGGSPAAWAAHLGSKAHRTRLEDMKSAKRRQPSPPPPAAAPPAKKLRSILKNGAKPHQQDETEPPPEPSPESVSTEATEADAPVPLVPEAPIPQGFFDDPVMDAKARNIQYKDPIEEEWEKFQKEMKAQTDLSAAIIAGEQEEATTERQIEEIEEQMRKLSRVIDLTRKKEEVAKLKAQEEPNRSENNEPSSDEDDNFEEYLDWRAKKSYR